MNTSTVQPHNEVGYFRSGHYEITPDFSDMTLLEARKYLIGRDEWMDYRVVDDEVTIETDVRSSLNDLMRSASGRSIRITEYTADMRLQGSYSDLASLLRRQEPMFVELALADSERMVIGLESGLQLVHYKQVIPLTAVWVYEGMTYEYQAYVPVALYLDESDILSEVRVEKRCRVAQQAAERNKDLADK